MFLPNMNFLHQKNYNNKHWLSVAEERILPGLTAKFSQNPHLKQILLSTQDNILLEASYDRTWGVGIPLRNKAIWNPDNWVGKNLMGKLLMKVRETLE